MKHFLTILAFLFVSLCISAQQQERKFDPKQFQKDQEAFITKEAKLTQQEAAAFFPLFRELHEKQRSLYKSVRDKQKAQPTDEKSAAQMIATMDKIELQAKKLEITYHAKFCKVIPATKVCRCIMAEDMFKHHMMDDLTKRNRGNRQKKK